MKILLIVLAAVITLLLIPVTAAGGYDGGPALEIKYLFFKKRILPKPEKPRAKAAAKEKKPKPARGPKPKRSFPLTALDMLGLLPKAFDMLLPPVRRLLKRTVIAGFSLEMTVAGADAADTAVKFGRVNGAVFYAVALLDRIMTLRVKRVDIYPGFAAEGGGIRFSARLRLCPLAALAAGAQLGISALILLIPAIKRRKRKNRAEKGRPSQINDRKDDRNGEEEPVGRSA